VTFAVRPPEVDESVVAGEDPWTYVARVARSKALAVPIEAGEVVLAADTTVTIDGRILAKPVDATEASAMLRTLSGRTHEVVTAVAVRDAAEETADVRAFTSKVTFAPLGDDLIAWYVGTGEPFDKAGGYAIQGTGALLVDGVDGSLTNVIGLPLQEIRAMLWGHGVRLAADVSGGGGAG
jgi:septum formation protein